MFYNVDSIITIVKNKAILSRTNKKTEVGYVVKITY